VWIPLERVSAAIVSNGVAASPGTSSGKCRRREGSNESMAASKAARAKVAAAAAPAALAAAAAVAVVGSGV
jgi:hypothetical protein